MGTDTPLAALSGNREPLFNYFKQRFAQVTNPPIDSIREEVVTSTTLYIGEAGNVLEEKPENCRVLKINNPILTNTDLMKIKNLKADGFKVEVLPIIYYKNTSLEKAVDRLYIEADRAYRDGANIIILSDRGVDENHVAIPSLLAVAALQQYLVKTKREHRFRSFLSQESRERFIILLHCLALVQVQSTLIWHRIQLSSLLTSICLTKIIMQQSMITTMQSSQVS